jgi:hypothetical protein
VNRRDYREVRAAAQALANERGYDYGLEHNRLFGEYTFFMLPAKNSRCGHELRCEVVHPEDIRKCKPGHGP